MERFILSDLFKQRPFTNSIILFSPGHWKILPNYCELTIGLLRHSSLLYFCLSIQLIVKAKLFIIISLSKDWKEFQKKTLKAMRSSSNLLMGKRCICGLVGHLWLHSMSCDLPWSPFTSLDPGSCLWITSLCGLHLCRTLGAGSCM